MVYINSKQFYVDYVFKSRFNTYMIYNYKVKNFYSFLDETEVDFKVNNLVPDSHRIANIEGVGRYAKILAVVGHNASGKTNLLKPLPFLGWFVCYSFVSLKPNQNIPIEPHFSSPSGVTEFEVEYGYGGELFKYELKLTKKRVLFEALYSKKAGEPRYRYLFKRAWNDIEDGYDIRQQGFGFKNSEAVKVRANASLIATAAQYNVPAALTAVMNASAVMTNVVHHGRHLNPSEIHSFYHEHNEYLQAVNKFLKDKDFGVDKIEIEVQTVAEEEGEKEYLTPVCHHTSNGKTHSLPLAMESSGTRGAFNILRHILPALKEGGIAVLDEMEADLHPHLVIEIIRMFISKETNPYDSQLLIASHSLEVLDQLEKEHLYLVEKDEECTSEAWRLDELKDVRRNENIYAKYMSGAYGAIPRFD